MSRPRRFLSLVRCRLAAVALVLVAAIAGCQSDTWQFARHDPFTERAASQVADAGHAYLAAKPPTIRAQFSSDGGVSMPSFGRTSSTTTSNNYSSSGPITTTIAPPSSYPANNSPANHYPTTNSGTTGGLASGTSSSGSTGSTTTVAPPTTAYASGGAQTVQPNPALAEDRNAYPRMVPPLTGDAAGMGPYEPDYAPDLSVYPSPLDTPTQELPLTILADEAMTGRFMFSVGVNSDAGLMGSIIVDEQNFDWTRLPTSWEDVRSGKAWRGDGQRFRLEASPGTVYHRYMVSWQEPYWLDSQVSLGLMGQYYTRSYLDWNEQWLGGRVALGYHFTHALTGSLAFRGMKVTVFNPVSPAPIELTEAVGDSSLYGFQAQLAHDTRDSQFLATQGHLIELSFEQVIGTYQYPQANLDIRKYFLLHERPDGSGRHVLSLSGRLAWTDTDTPIYENFFAGGFTTIRGFDFRGASPRDNATGVFVGGHAMVLASAEYLFPITADDMLRGVVFCDTGTVEPSFSDWTENYRVAPGFGLRITIPAMGPAPIALDFAFPVSHEPGDRIENFSFWVGFLR
ncbi:MAG TPA: BamA/TamA family outer membrane protein [Thermoguttaceae bacterium]|nr:BamA/TamA family outer membrane protein [Thermoguttaceae bacterium]